MAEDLAKLNRLRVNAGKDELKSWKAPQHKLEAAIKKFEDDGFIDVLPGANPEAQPLTDDPEVAAVLPKEEPKGDRYDEAETLKESAVTPSLAESAMSRNVGKVEKKPEKETTKGKASLARGLDSDTMAVQSRARVRDHREAEKKANKAKQDKRAAAGKDTTPRVKNDNEITVAEIARELDVDPKVARAKLRRHTDRIKKAVPKWDGGWTFPKTAAAEIKKILQGKK